MESLDLSHADLIRYAAALPKLSPSAPFGPRRNNRSSLENEKKHTRIPSIFFLLLVLLFQVLDDPDPFVLKSAMTTVSVLTRVLPFILEAYTDPETGQVDPALHRMFWETEEEPPPPPSAAATATGDGAGAGAGAEAGVALGSAMVSATMRLLFTRQLTVDVYSSCESVDAGVAMLPVLLVVSLLLVTPFPHRRVVVTSFPPYL